MRVSLIRAARAAIIAFIILASSTVVLAQSIMDPRIAEFDPSPDHSTVTSGGTAVVQGYSLALYVSGASTPTQTVNLGKPAPDPDGKIRVNFVNLLATPLGAGVTYEARVSAVGPGGSGESTVSNPFAFSTQCAPTISQTSQSFPSVGGTGSFLVNPGTGCAWARCTRRKVSSSGRSPSWRATTFS